MGGPCRLLRKNPQPGKMYTSAPACTDNFQVCPFLFDGQLWESVEQCYQAMKFADPKSREEIRQMSRRPNESDAAHGMRVWSAGQGNRVSGAFRPDWDAVKVELMYRACRAKYLQHPELCRELLSTGDLEIKGAHSTSWNSRKTGRAGSWTEWNGLIQTRLREEMRRQQLLSQDIGVLKVLEARFSEYLSFEGGTGALPLPGELEASAPLPVVSEVALGPSSGDGAKAGYNHMQAASSPGLAEGGLAISGVARPLVVAEKMTEQQQPSRRQEETDQQKELASEGPSVLLEIFPTSVTSKELASEEKKHG